MVYFDRVKLNASMSKTYINIVWDEKRVAALSAGLSFHQGVLNG